MKKLLAILMAAALCLVGFAMAEEEAAGGKVSSEIENGEFVIRVNAGDDLAWVADDMAQDPSVVELASADNVDGAFVARYAPVGDGDVTVGVRHYTGIACDEMMTWDLHVENGAVTEVIGGSYAAGSDDAVSDSYLLGEWLEAETQFTQMTIEKNPERGWDVEIASPMTHGAYIFKTTVQYDCELNSFVYDKGKFWDVPITDSEEEVELGEAAIAGTTGSLTFVGDDENLMLEWYDDEHPDAIIRFEKAGAEAATESELYANSESDLMFMYDPAAFEVTSENFTDDEDTVVLGFQDASWGEGYIKLYLAEADENSGFPTRESFAEMEEALGIQVEQMETWSNFSNVFTYTVPDDGSTETVFIAPVYDDDDSEIEDVLTVTVATSLLDDEAAAMARDDAISAVLDTLEVVD